tara:strand:+ start:527 stop:943 length:417 start_codon:yes stop_codon:yes gene_type:complete
MLFKHIALPAAVGIALLTACGAAHARPSQGVYCDLTVKSREGKVIEPTELSVTFVVSSEAGATTKIGTLQLDETTLFEGKLDESLNTYRIALPESRRPDFRQIMFSLNRTSLFMTMAFSDAKAKYMASGKCHLISPKI